MDDTTKNGTAELTANQKVEILERSLRYAAATIQANSMASQRQALGGYAGMQFSGDRDIYKAAGYPVEIEFNDYMGKYLRQDIAGRIVDAPADETWRKSPIVTDTDGDEPTPFMIAWDDLTDTEKVKDELDDSRSVWHYMTRLDRATGIGQYGVLLLGVQDGSDLKEPLQKNGVKNKTKGLLYLRVCDESNATVATTVTDRADRRYGLPETYKIVIDDRGTTAVVHWTRVVHVVERPLNSEVLGTPRLERIYNILEDLLKVTAGAGESAWKLMYKGLIMSTKDGYEAVDGEVSKTKAEEYIHGLMRVLAVEGMDVKVEGGEIVDPSEVIRIYVALISAATGIPQRILLGSERGQLASLQDEGNWNDQIETRRLNYAGPVMLRPFINRLIYCGILPVPENGRYTIKWEDDELNPAEVVAMNKDKAEIIVKLSPPGAVDQVIDFDEVRELALLPKRADETAVLLDDEDTDVEAE